MPSDYLIGSDKSGNWLAISNGEKAYKSWTDLKAHSYVGAFDFKQATRSEDYRAKARHLKATMARRARGEMVPPIAEIREDFSAYCKKNDLECSSPFDSDHVFMLIFGPFLVALLTGAIAAELGDYLVFTVSTIVSCLVSAYFFFRYDWEKSARNVFKRAEHAFKQRLTLEYAATIFLHEWPKLEREIAKKRWEEYHRLISFSRVNELTGVEFEKFVADLYTSLGYSTERTKVSGDFGIDIIATKGEEKIAIQVKRYKGNVGVAAVQQALSGTAYYSANQAAVVTNSYFTRQAEELAKKTKVDLIDSTDLRAMCRQRRTATKVPDFSFERFNSIRAEINHVLGNHF